MTEQKNEATNNPTPAYNPKDLIEVYLPRDSSNKQPYIGSINGKRFVVQRGKKTLLTPDEYAVFKNSISQDLYVSDLIDSAKRLARTHGISG